MQTYSAKIQLGGSLHNEVMREELTAPEILILRRIHGREHVVNIVAGKHVAREDHEERDRLAGIYGRALAAIKGVGTIETLLGPEGTPLVKAIPGVDILPAPKTGKQANTFGRTPKADPIEPVAPVEPISETEFS